MTAIEDCRAALASSNTQAFLRVIRQGETNQDDIAYRMMFGGSTFDDFGHHPNLLHVIGNLRSTAAGAFQFLGSTWGVAQRALDLYDFSPPNQDLAAVWLIRNRGALDDVLAGRIESAIKKCAQEWASLPGSPYGQPTRTLPQALATYEKYGGKYTTADRVETPAETAPVPSEVAPEIVSPIESIPAGEGSPQESKPMAPIIAALLPSLVDLLPKLGQVFGGSEVAQRNVKAATMAFQVVKDAVGATNEQEAITKMQADPAVLQVAAKAVESNWYAISGATEETIATARDFATKYSESQTVRTVFFRFTFLEFFSLLIVLICFAGGVAVLVWGKLNDQLVGAIVMLMLIGGFVGVKDFWYGSSHGSKQKDGGAV